MVGLAHKFTAVSRKATYVLFWEVFHSNSQDTSSRTLQGNNGIKGEYYTTAFDKESKRGK